MFIWTKQIKNLLWFFFYSFNFFGKLYPFPDPKSLNIWQGIYLWWSASKKLCTHLITSITNFGPSYWTEKQNSALNSTKRTKIDYFPFAYKNYRYAMQTNTPCLLKIFISCKWGAKLKLIASVWYNDSSFQQRISSNYSGNELIHKKIPSKKTVKTSKYKSGQVEC